MNIRTAARIGCVGASVRALLCVADSLSQHDLDSFNWVDFTDNFGRLQCWSIGLPNDVIKILFWAGVGLSLTYFSITKSAQAKRIGLVGTFPLAVLNLLGVWGVPMELYFMIHGESINSILNILGQAAYIFIFLFFLSLVLKRAVVVGIFLGLVGAAIPVLKVIFTLPGGWSNAMWSIAPGLSYGYLGELFFLLAQCMITMFFAYLAYKRESTQ